MELLNRKHYYYNNKFVYFLLFSYVFSCVLAFYYGSLEYRLFSVSLGFTAFLLILFFGDRKNTITSILIFLFFLFFSLFNFGWSEFRSAFIVLALFSCWGITYWTFSLKKGYLIYKYFFFFCLFLTSFLLFVLGYTEQDFSKLMVGSSRNVYSAIFLVAAIGYVLQSIVRNEKPSLILMTLFFLLNLFLYGRTGIALSLILYLVILYFYYKKTLFLFLTLFFLISLYEIDFFISYIENSTNFSRGLDSPRFDMMNEYISHMSSWKLIFGGDYTSLPTILFHGGNPHNAYIRMHGYLGLAFFVFISAVMISFFCMISDRNYIMIWLLFIVCLRAYFDIVFFFNLFDFLFFPVVFYFYFRRFYVVQK